MGKPFSFKITEEEKQQWSEIAVSMGISLEQLINIAIAEALEHDSTGVYDDHS